MADIFWAKPEDWKNLKVKSLPTPCYLVDFKLLKKNLEILNEVQEATGAKILMAFKGFAMWSTFPLARKYLKGIAASSQNEARLGAEEFRKEVHTFSPAFKEDEFAEIMKYSNHIIFNSFEEWKRFRPALKKSRKKISVGLRVNPEHREVKVSLYDPSAPYSRLGITKKNFKAKELQGVSGLHFHALCELNADSLERTLMAFERKFGEFLPKMKWVNFGGGHHITRPDYNRKLLVEIITRFKKKYPHLEVYLEPGEAIALNTGVLVARVLDIVHNEKRIAILDTSAAAHMPDTLEMPYRPEIAGARPAGKYRYTYRLGGISCLAGDVIGDYSFPKKLNRGDKLIFLDMAHYTMVKNNTFNGINLPSILIKDLKGKIKSIKKFGYEDYKNRLS
ncbi:MAG: carboxynorspermidine decarboxylase [Patescibacteria group bacterium]|jgi:carboxynorspermidine decarboxylase